MSSVGSRAGTSFTITVLKIKHTTFSWTCFPPTSCSAPPLHQAARPLLHLSLQNGKENSCRASVSPASGCCCSPTAVPTLLLPSRASPSAGLCPFHGSPEPLGDQKQKMAIQLFFFSLLKTIISEYLAREVMLVKQYLPDAKPLKYLSFLKEKNILRNCPWAVSLDL